MQLAAEHHASVFCCHAYLGNPKRMTPYVQKGDCLCEELSTISVPTQKFVISSAGRVEARALR